MQLVRAVGACVAAASCGTELGHVNPVVHSCSGEATGREGRPGFNISVASQQGALYLLRSTTTSNISVLFQALLPAIFSTTDLPSLPHLTV